MANEERLQILDMIAQGKISAQQGIELLRALDDEASPVEDFPMDESTAVAAQPTQTPDNLPVEGQAVRQAEVIPAEALPPVMETAAQVEPEAPAFEQPVVVSQAEVMPPVVETSPQTEIPSPEAAPNAPLPSESQTSPTIVEELPPAPSFDPKAAKWRGWWRIPLWIGVIATILTGILLYTIYNAGGFNFWFACAWFPFMLSVAIIALAWASRSAHWLHVRVHQRPGERPQNIAISLPIPLTLMAWGLRTFRSKIPNIQGMNPDEMILTLKHVSPEQPFYVEVNEDNGERVEVYIG
jgi:SHOCT-like domain